MPREKRTEETKRSEGNQSPSTPKMSARRDDASANDGTVPKQPNIDMCLTGFTEQQGFRKRVCVCQECADVPRSVLQRSNVPSTPTTLGSTDETTKAETARPRAPRYVRRLLPIFACSRPLRCNASQGQ